jgi:hypothetical protein
MIRSALFSAAACVRRVNKVALVLVVAATLVIGVPEPADAQAPNTVTVSDTLQEVRLVDGSSFFGQITAVDADRITLVTTTGVRLELMRGQIQMIRAARGRMVEGRFWRDDPNKTRLFFAPTGRSLRAGEGYFGVYELFIPFVSYGVTNQFTISGGSPFYIGMFEVTPPFYLAPKLQVLSAPQTEVSVGVLAVFIPGSWGWEEDSRTRSVGIAYGVGTFGGNDNAATAGIGWGYADGEFSARPAVMLGGEVRVGASTKLITENWFVPGSDGGVLSGGVRFFGERLSADAGLIAFVGSGGGGCCLPLVNFVYAFGGRR